MEAVAIVAMAVIAATMPAIIRPTTLFSLANRPFTSYITCRPLSWYQGHVKLVGPRRYGICLTTKIVFPLLYVLVQAVRLKVRQFISYMEPFFL
jgi:hypothetical protein